MTAPTETIQKPQIATMMKKEARNALSSATVTDGVPV